jgi:hypothetical protein
MDILYARRAAASASPWHLEKLYSRSIGKVTLKLLSGNLERKCLLEIVRCTNKHQFSSAELALALVLHWQDDTGFQVYNSKWTKSHWCIILSNLCWPVRFDVLFSFVYIQLAYFSYLSLILYRCISLPNLCVIHVNRSSKKKTCYWCILLYWLMLKFVSPGLR